MEKQQEHARKTINLNGIKQMANGSADCKQSASPEDIVRIGYAESLDVRIFFARSFEMKEIGSNFELNPARYFFKKANH
jgi:hypothetical protein